MILRSITVQGWRCFLSPVTFGPFDPTLNILFAPNACGKTTLFEALRRALLDNHKVGGKDIEAIKPWGRDLTPIVQVLFDHQGDTFRITKRFLDQPFSKLEREENGRLVPLAEGPSADERVRAVLTRNAPGKGLARAEHWGLAQVLWAPQGDLSLVPLSGEVLADIRTSLGAQVGGAGPVEKIIGERYAQFFTPGGKLLSGKNAPRMVLLKEALQKAVEKRAEASRRLEEYDDLSRKVRDFQLKSRQARYEAEEMGKLLATQQGKANAYRDLLSEKKERESRLQALEARLATLLKEVGDEKNLAEEMARTGLEFEGARAGLQEAEKKLAGYDEDPLHILERLQQRLEAAWDTSRRALADEKITEGALRQLGGQGAYSLLSRAEEEAAELERDLAAERLQVNAVRLLFDTLKECRSEMTAGLVAPVEKKANYLLQRIAGKRPGPLKLNEGLNIPEVLPDPAGTGVPLDQVSGGEREQIYLATRLALAELLASTERQLVVLDDVLTFTDAARMARVLDVLEESAQRLQILIITCHPERYRGLQAAQFIDLEEMVRTAAGEI